jgi:hypothetical protein
VEFWELEQLVHLVVVEVSQPADGVAGPVGEVGAREIVLAGPAVLSAAAFDLAARAARAGIVSSGSGHSRLLSSGYAVSVAAGPVRTREAGARQDSGIVDGASTRSPTTEVVWTAEAQDTLRRE